MLVGSPAAGAVNAPSFDGPESEWLQPFLEAAYRIGRFYPQYAQPSSLPSFALIAEGELANFDPGPFVTTFLSGLLQATTDRRVTIVNAEAIAKELGVRVEARTGPRRGAYASTLRFICGSTTITGTVVGSTPRIVDLDGFEIDATPVGAMVLTKHRDVPGMIGKSARSLGMPTSTSPRCKSHARWMPAVPRSWFSASIAARRKMRSRSCVRSPESARYTQSRSSDRISRTPRRDDVE